VATAEKLGASVKDFHLAICVSFAIGLGFGFIPMAYKVIRTEELRTRAEKERDAAWELYRILADEKKILESP